MRKIKPTVISLFSGCGGLDLGLYQSNWEGVFAIEKNPFAFETLRFNLIDNKKHFNWPAWLPQKEHDINEVLKKYKNELKKLEGKIDLIVGGPPCQGFSMAGKRIETDERNKLVFSYIKFIKIIKPKLLFFENVKGFTYAFGKGKRVDAVPYSKIVTDELINLGYDISPHVIDFSDFGIPQRRKRFILIGVRNDYGSANAFMEIILKNKNNFLKNKGLPYNPTLKDAISDLLRSNGESPTPDRKGFLSGKYGKQNSKYQKFLRNGFAKVGSVPNSHSFAKQSDEKISCYKRLLAEYPEKGKRIDGRNRAAWGIKQRSITVLDPNTISPTITGQPDDYLHYCEPRIMTVRECARIQSFPDWYEIKCKYTTGGNMRKIEVPRYSQIGNAIPPLFAEQAGMALKEMLKNGK